MWDIVWVSPFPSVGTAVSLFLRKRLNSTMRVLAVTNKNKLPPSVITTGHNPKWHHWLPAPPPLALRTSIYIRRGRAKATHYTHHQVCLMVSRNTTLDPSLGLLIGPAYEAGLSAGIWRECVPPQRRKKERKTPLSRACVILVLLCLYRFLIFSVK